MGKNKNKKQDKIEKKNLFFPALLKRIKVWNISVHASVTKYQVELASNFRYNFQVASSILIFVRFLGNMRLRYHDSLSLRIDID